MTLIVSIITAVHEPNVPFLAEAYDSVAAQELPAEWSWEWLVQEDGRSGAVAAALPKDDRISPGEGTKGGPGTARNLALGRASGSIVRVLDADDRLTTGAIGRDIAILDQRQEVGWTTTSVLDLMPDGTTVGWEHSDPPDGPLPPGLVLDYFRQNSYRLPVHPATLCIRRGLALALGGWMALPGGEDTGLLLAASAVSTGYFIGEPGLLYRKHPGQTTEQPGYRAGSEWAARMRLIEARALALQAGAGLRMP